MNMPPLEMLPAGRRVLIARNPTAGARDTAAHVRAFCAALAERGYQAEEFTAIPELLANIEQARERGELRCVVAAGGDGTVAMLTNNTPRGTPIAVLPLGTENLLAKYLEVPLGPEGGEWLADWIDTGVAAPLDAGLVNGRLFLVMISCGFDAEVVRRVHTQRTGHIHHFTYAKPILDAMRSYRFPELRVYCEQPTEKEDNKTSSAASAATPAGATSWEMTERRACWAFVFNLPRYAAGLSFAPQASGTDGLVDVCTFRQGSVLHGLRYLAGIAAGWHQGWPDCRVTRTRRMRIECDEKVPYQCDGDPGGYLPVEIEVLPGRVTMVVGPQWARRHGYGPALASAHYSRIQETTGDE